MKYLYGHNIGLTDILLCMRPGQRESIYHKVWVLDSTSLGLRLRFGLA